MAPLCVDAVRLIGGAAAHLIDSGNVPYNDIDLLFDVELYDLEQDFERVRSAVLSAVVQLLPASVRRECLTPKIVGDAYISNMVRVVGRRTDGAGDREFEDRWSLLALGHYVSTDVDDQQPTTVDMKFADRLHRQYQYSADSFQMNVDPMLQCHRAGTAGRVYPQVVAESLYGNYATAAYHLERRLIATKNVWEVRGGGLLKYSAMRAMGYQVSTRSQCGQRPNSVRNLEQAVCRKFYTDFLKQPGKTVLEKRREVAEMIVKYANMHSVAFVECQKIKRAFISFLVRTVIGTTGVYPNQLFVEMMKAVEFAYNLMAAEDPNWFIPEPNVQLHPYDAQHRWQVWRQPQPQPLPLPQPQPWTLALPQPQPLMAEPLWHYWPLPTIQQPLVYYNFPPMIYVSVAYFSALFPLNSPAARLVRVPAMFGVHLTKVKIAKVEITRA